MRLYVSGPMTGLPEHNYPTFAAASARDACDGFRWDDLLDPRPVGGDS